MDIRISRTDSSDPDFVSLVARLTEFLAVLNGEHNDFYAQFNKIDLIRNAVVIYLDGQAVGCGAFRPAAVDTVEIKRMFVDPDCRGKGLGFSIVGELEKWACELGHTRAILETSKRLESAVGLYLRSGYRVIPNYPPYEHIEDSVCMEKAI